jgi:hypothetical protein
MRSNKQEGQDNMISTEILEQYSVRVYPVRKEWYSMSVFKGSGRDRTRLHYWQGPACNIDEAILKARAVAITFAYAESKR